MKTLLPAAFAATLFATAAVCQVTIPPHAALYTGFSRGFNFTAQANMVLQDVELPLDAYVAGDEAAYLIRVNGTTAYYSRGNVPTVANPGARVGVGSIVIAPGDVVDVIGNWSPATGQTNFTARNSYGNTTPYATTILGTPHTLNRNGWQWDIGDPLWVSTGTTGTFLAATSGQMGRVLLYAVPPAGLFPSFTSNVTSGASPLTVNFTDTSFSSDPGGILGWAWDFDGDSVVDSTLQNPSFVYQNCGTYNVTLTVVDALHGPQTTTSTGYIITDTVTASFTHALIAPGVMQFTDTSVPTPTSWAWDFDGDSVIDDTTQNPAHFYPAACTAANVTLTASRLCGPADTATAAIVITPNTLTATTLGGNGITGATAGNVFDVQVTNPDGVNICAVTCRPYNVVGSFTVDLYVSDGSYLDMVGGVVRHAVPSAWRLIGSGTGVTTGGTTTTSPLAFVALNNNVYLPQGNYSVAAMMTFATSNIGVAYTTAAAANWGPFVDSNMTINPNPTTAAGIGKSTLFGVGGNAQRVWNGAFHYSTWSNDGASAIGFAGTGCANSLGQVSSLTPSGNPQLGTTLTIVANNLPQSVGVMCTGYSNTMSLFGALPYDATSIGAPGCFLRVSTEAVLFLTGLNNSIAWNFGIPNNPAFSGQQFYNQVIVLDPAANAVGAVMSDATGMLIGN